MVNQAPSTKHQAPIDKFGREIKYLRISVTDRCNYRCGYCYVDDTLLPREKILTLEEIAKVAEIAVNLGFKAIKLTGGEPLLRKNICSLIKDLSKLPIEDLSLTTNGFNLAETVLDLKNSGLKRITVSLDSLNKDTFRKISKTGSLEDVLKGINQAIKVFGEVKINVVVIEGINDLEIFDFLNFAKTRPVHLRFIELVSNNGYKNVSTSKLKDIISSKITFENKVINGNGPAESYKIEGYKGTVGFISLKEQDFCEKCNRLRIKANGSIKPCLYNKEELSFLEPLRKGDFKTVKRLILKAVNEKPLKSGELITQMRSNGG